MSFFKNINIDIKEIPAGSKVKVGDVGKTMYVCTLTLNYETAILESPQVTSDEIIEICNKLNAFPRFEEDKIYIQELQKTYENNEEINFIPYHTSPNSYIPYGQSILKTTYDKREDKYERFYKVEKVLNHPDAAHLKRPSTIIRHACRDCAFYGRCKDAPSCFTRYIREISSKDRMTLKDAVYFKYDKKNDKLISSTTTPCESSKASYISRYEWSKSLFADQHNKH